MAYKIAFGGIHIESSTFTPYISGERDFKIRRGNELLQRYPWLEKYEDEAEPIPLVHARALPGGVVSREFFEAWFSEFMTLLQSAMAAQKIDGILLDIHGAMVVESLEDAEGYFAEKVRALVGNKVIISAAMDLHGNVSDKLFDSCDMLTCCRTAPHIDEDETRERAFSHLLFALQNSHHSFYKVKVDIPILLPGEKTSTEMEPGKILYAIIDDCLDDNVTDVSIWMGFPWADEARCHGAVVALGTDEKSVEKSAKRISDFFWRNREEFSFVGPTDTMKNSIHQALISPEKPFFISDTGDNPGAGGAGDMNLVLKSFCELDRVEKIEKKILFASIYDEESVKKIYEKSVGETILLNLGGKTDKSYGGALPIEATIDFLFYGEKEGKSAVVHSNNIFVIITENRFQYGNNESFVRAGIQNLSDFDIVVVKMGYLEPDLSRVAKGWVMALTQGAVSQDIVRLPYRNLQRPLFPFDVFDEGDAFALRTVRGCTRE